VDARRRLATLEGHVQNITYVSFHPDGDLLASYSWDGAVRLWDPATGRPLMQVPFASVIPRFSSDGRWLGVALQGEQAQLLEAVPSREYRTLPCNLGAGQGGYYGGDISPDSRLLALGMADGVRLWDLSGGRELAFLPVGDTRGLLFQPGGRELLSCGSAGLCCWPIQQRGADAPEVRLGPRRAIALPVGPTRVARSHDGRMLAVVSDSREVGLLVDTATGAVRGPQLSHPAVCYVALSPDGKWVATSGWHSDRVRLWDADTGKMVHEWVRPGAVTVFFTPDSRALLIGREDEFSFWDVETRQLLRRLRRDAPQYPGYVAFSPDGKLMALEMAPGIVHLKEVATGRTVARLEDPHGDRTTWMAFTPDGTRLVTAAGYARAVHVWDLRAIRARLKAMGLDRPAFSAGEDGDAYPSRYGAPKLRVVGADPETHFRLMSAKGQLAEAVVEYRQAIGLRPDWYEAHYWLATALWEQGRQKDAQAAFREARRLKPKQPDGPPRSTFKTPWSDSGQWAVKDQEIHQLDESHGHIVLFGDPDWTDYDFEAEVEIIAGGSEVGLIFRATGRDDFLYAVVGAWGNTSHSVLIQDKTDSLGIGFAKGQSKKGCWYRVRVEARGERVKMFLDGKLLMTVAAGQRLRGCVGLVTNPAHARFRNLKVTDATGMVLWEGVQNVLPK
jgi:WD40 repeat protein